MRLMSLIPVLFPTHVLNKGPEDNGAFPVSAELVSVRTQNSLMNTDQ